MARGAKKSIELYVKELAHPEFTKLLLEKARHGVSVKIRLAEPDNDPLDNASQRLILKALRESPDLDISVKSYDWNQFPYRHFNAVIADNEVGVFGTLYRRPGAALGYLQARRYVPAHVAHPRRQGGAHACERAGAWIEQLGKRRPPNVVTVALANKMARTIWALLAHDRPYEKNYVSSKPA